MTQLSPASLVSFVSERLTSTLGRAMYMSVADSRLGADMPPLVVTTATPVVAVWHQLLTSSKPVALITDHHSGVAVGWVSVHHLLWHVLPQALPHNARMLLAPVSTVCQVTAGDAAGSVARNKDTPRAPPVPTVSLDDSAAVVLRRCAAGDEYLFVRNPKTGKLVGVVTTSELVRFVCSVMDESVASRLAEVCKQQK